MKKVITLQQFFVGRRVERLVNMNYSPIVLVTI